MKTRVFLSLVLFVLAGKAFASGQPVRFISDPSLSPDGEQVVFVYDDDLWEVPVNGGQALRLTAMDGRESLPRYSPDGKWIAFSGRVDGNTNVFLVPAEGGEITRLTFHQSFDRVDSWSWDSRYIYFHSSRENMSSVYRVEIDGGTPERVFEHYFNIPHHVVEHPQSGALVFTESWESLNQPQRKRYRGSHNPDLLSYHAENDDYSQLTDFEGKDLWPTIDRQGNLYFVSDEGNEEYNLYTLTDNGKMALTQFDSSIGRPQVSANGKKVVFERDYQLYVYDVAAGEASRPEVRLSHKNTLPLDQNFNVHNNITWFDVSPDNKKLAFVSRGELFVSDIEGNYIRQMEVNPAERVTEVVWGADNKTLYYFRTVNGWTNLFTISADGKGGELALEENVATSRLLSLNPDRTQGVYLNGRDQVKLVDLEENTTRVIAEAELWGFQNSPPGFSPDGRYVLFTAYHNFEQNIHIHDLEQGQTVQLTNTGMSERVPSWSPCGKYIYFATDRYQPNYPRGNTQDRLYRIPLYRFSETLKSEKFDAMFSEEDEEGSDVDPMIQFDLEGITERWEPIRVANIGRQWAPRVYEYNGHQVMFFTSNHDKGQWSLWKTEIKPFERLQPERLEGPSPGMGLRIVEAEDNFYLLAGGNIQRIHTDSGRLEAIDLRHSFSRNLSNEFSQIFYETWAALDENFYEDNFHGVDWQRMRDRYGSHLPYVMTRDNLRKLVNDMLGELNASHTGFSSSGEEEDIYYAACTAETGIVFSGDDPFVVEKVLPGSNLDLSDPVVRPGDVLLSVNSREVNPCENRNRYFYFSQMPEELEMCFDRSGEEVVVRMKPHTPGQVDNLRYDEWIESNRRYVAEKTNERVGYVFMKNMSEGALNQFLIDMSTHARGKDALIFDIRFNRGGNVHDDVLQFLAQEPYMKWRYRGGSDAPQPNFAPSGNPMVMLINERSLSDAEMTAQGFRELGLGTIVGTETYRWIIFTSGKAMVDGSYTRLPSWGCYSLEGENLELTGVAPHVEIRNTFYDRLQGNDPQLDRAIEEVMESLKDQER
ncbi:MAG: S41 family peptidase [Bacteroidales bacterium]